jgi:hypothetical protein
MISDLEMGQIMNSIAERGEIISAAHFAYFPMTAQRLEDSP